MTSEHKRDYWKARIGSIVQTSNQRGARAIRTLLAVQLYVPIWQP